MILLWVIAVLLPALCIRLRVLPGPFIFLCRKYGRHLQRRAEQRREILTSRVRAEEKTYADGKAQSDDGWERVEREKSQSKDKIALEPADDEKTAGWSGLVGFFHPFCNAGGGGERVLWAAIHATQKRWPEAICVVYTGDLDVNKEQILDRVKDRFNIQLYPPTIFFIYLTKRHYVLSSTWPHFTLLGQSVGSLVLAHEAFSLIVPDIFIDTMGYAFTLGLSKLLFPGVPIGAYVHYPTISTDMLGSLDEGGKGVNGGAGIGYKGQIKRWYWHLFAWLYSSVGGTIDVVMTNSSWTQAHISELWSPHRHGKLPVQVVFPPVAVDEVGERVQVSEESEGLRQPHLVYIAQFRPEKKHSLIINAFATYLRKYRPANTTTPRLILIGSVRDDADEKLVYSLRLLAHERQVKDTVEFVLNASWPRILEYLQTSSVGVNGMWNEHFGIGVVEYQAAGLISVVHNSGGPKQDIVVPIDGQPTGFHAETEDEFAQAFGAALELSQSDALAMRHRAQKSASRFTEEVFAQKWVAQMHQLITLQQDRAK